MDAMYTMYNARALRREIAMIIQSLLDTDLYKFTMMQVVLHHFPGAQVEYRFTCRSNGSICARISARSVRKSRILAHCDFATTNSPTCAACAS